MYYKTEGVILNRSLFGEAHLKLDVLTQEFGLLTIFCYGALSKKSRWRGVATQFTVVEIVFKKNLQAICTCHELSPIRYFPILKQDLAKLKTAVNLSRVILKQFLPEMKISAVYDMLLFFLDMICEFDNYAAIYVTFILKVVKHEGLFKVPISCSVCHQFIEELAFYCGDQFFCNYHKFPEMNYLSSTELKLIYTLTEAKKKMQVINSQVSAMLCQKVETIFQNSC